MNCDRISRCISRFEEKQQLFLNGVTLLSRDKTNKNTMFESGLLHQMRLPCQRNPSRGDRAINDANDEDKSH